jgi:hypothetical protein
MKRNVAGQVISCGMTALDGSEFTGAVTVYITKDGGTQAAGSVGSGACTHKGHGEHEYLPSAGDTNAAYISWTFVGSGAVTKTLPVYPGFPQSGDAFTRTLAKGTDITGFNDVSQAQVNAEADTALADAGVTAARQAHLDTDVSSRLASSSYTAPDNGTISAIASIVAALPSASTIAAAVWAAGQRTLTSFGTLVADVWANTSRTLSDKTGFALTSAYDAAKTAAQASDIPTASITAIKNKTDKLTFDGANNVAAGVETINGTPITGDGNGTPFNV